MGKLHDRLKEIGYGGHVLEVYLVRVLFLLFSEDTTIFNKQQFQEFVEQRTNEDGSDLAAKLQELFQVLNTPIENRFKNLDEQLADLYDPLAMPPALVKAHNELDKPVDLAYRTQPFTNEAGRMMYLFELYEKYEASLFAKEKSQKIKGLQNAEK